ncbi:MAG: heme exporter protein CcmD [Spongiibacteraceae bacterium]|nr:heme exporter protein CcmD [Spongiibacteraceae bacterium]
MQFDSWHAFWVMGGHGPYVWAAYGITALVLIALVVLPCLRGRRLRRELAAALAREARRSGAAEPNLQ